MQDKKELTNIIKGLQFPSYRFYLKGMNVLLALPRHCVLAAVKYTLREVQAVPLNRSQTMRASTNMLHTDHASDVQRHHSTQCTASSRQHYTFSFDINIIFLAVYTVMYTCARHFRVFIKKIKLKIPIRRPFR